MKSYIFSVVIEEDVFENGRASYHAHCPGLKGCHTWGHTSEEALVNVQEAIQLNVDDLLKAGESIPVNPDQGIIERDTPSVAVNV